MNDTSEASEKPGTRIMVYDKSGDFLGGVTSDNFAQICTLFKKRVHGQRKCTSVGLAVQTEDGVRIVTCRRLVGRLPPGDYRGELVLRVKPPAKSTPERGEAWRCI